MLAYDMKRLSLTMPEHVYERLAEEVPSGQTSQFISSAVEEKLSRLPRTIPLNELVSATLELRKTLAGSMTREEILDRIHEGRA